MIKIAGYNNACIIKEKMEAIESRMAVILAGKEAEKELDDLINDLKTTYGLDLSFLKED